MLILSFLILSISLEEGDQDNRKEGEQQQQQQQKEEEDGALDRQECQAALALLRHAKWFQVSWSQVTFIESAGV